MKVIALAVGLFALIEAAQCVGLARGLYCGLEICYDVLGVDRETFNKTGLAKAYRKLAKQFHPDRVKDEEARVAAEERFRLIATAYETLKDDETRGFYDYYLDHPEQRYYNYYQYYRMRTAPKVDIRLVIIGVVSVISLIQYISAKSKYTEAIDYAVKVAKYRKAAIDIASERGLLDVDPKTGKVRKNRKNRDNVDVEAIIRAIVEENMDVRGGYKKESVYDTIAWYIISFPVILFRYAIWKARWIKKYNINGEEYEEEDKLYLIRKHFGMTECQFICLEPEEIDEFLEEKLWIKENFTQWKEAKEVEEREKMANSGKYKRYRRYMKNNTGEPTMTMMMYHFVVLHMIAQSRGQQRISSNCGSRSRFCPAVAQAAAHSYTPSDRWPGISSWKRRIVQSFRMMLCNCGRKVAMQTGDVFYHEQCCPVATPKSQFHAGPSTAMRTMVSASSSRALATYELSDDLNRRQAQVLERRYGGRIRAHAAATKIQRAFREYRMRLQFRHITAHSNAPQRMTRRCPEHMKSLETPYFRESFRPSPAHLTHNALSQPSLRYQPSTSLLTQLRVEREEIHAERPIPDQRSEVSMRVRRTARSPPAPSLMGAFGPVSRPYIELMSPRLSNRRLIVPHLPPSTHVEGGGRSTSPLVWVPRVQSASSTATNSTTSHTNSLPRVNRGNSSSQLTGLNGAGFVKPRDVSGQSRIPQSVSSSQCAMLKWTDQQRRRYYRIALNFFNKKPDRGIHMLINWGFIENNSVSIAKLLIERRGLSKQMIGEFIGTLHSTFHADVLHSFIAEVDMRDMDIDVALRQTLLFFRLPGEAQKIDRIMQVFSQHYCKCNPSSSAVQCGPDAIYILAFAIIMLNTDLHSPSVKPANKMKLEDFIKNIQGTKDGLLFKRELLVGIYQRIRETPFVQGEDHVNQVAAIDKRLVGKDKPKLAEPFRRLICSCRFYQISDVNKKQSADAHQREVYLFNDMIVIAKLMNKKKGTSQCTLKHWSSTVDMKIEPFRTQYYKHGLLINCPGGMQILLNSRSDDDRFRFLADARESAAESTEMEQIRIELELDKQSLLSLNRSESQRDSGLPEFENGDAKGAAKNGIAKPSRRLSFNSLDSGMVEEGGDFASP